MKKTLLLLLSFISIVFHAQDLKIESGNFDFLKDQTDLNVELKFDNAVYQEKNFTEAQYLENRKQEIIARKGEKVWQNWTYQWKKFKDAEYVNYFFKGLNGKSKKTLLDQNANAKYTLIIDAKWVYAGWYGGMIGSQEAKISGSLYFVETQNPSNVLMKINIDKFQGKQMNEQFSWEYGRIAAVYEVLGKQLKKEIKKVKK